MLKRTVKISRTFTLEGKDEEDLDFMVRQIQILAQGCEFKTIKDMAEVWGIKVEEKENVRK